MWRKVRVRAKLAALGLIRTDLCPMCKNVAETVDHIYFECSYTQTCCKLLEDKLQTKIRPVSLEDCNVKLKSVTGRFKKQVLQCCFAPLLYAIWRQRNLSIWENKLEDADNVVKNLLLEVYQRISHVMSFKVSQCKRDWLKMLLC